MNEHRFMLQPYRGSRSRYKCPQCQHRGTFKRYIDTETQHDLAEHAGRCDREDSCGYHFTPKQYFAENPGDVRGQQTPRPCVRPVANMFNHLPVTLMRESMVQKAYIHNNFVVFLAKMFGWETALQAAEKYQIGTSRHWPGAAVFWQQDKYLRVRTGKIMLYDHQTGKRVKQPFNHVTWVHKIVGKTESRKSPEVASTAINIKYATGRLPDVRSSGLSDFKMEQCFFGEHLLWHKPNATVAIAESEKTAVMASVMMPGLVWLAAGSLNGLDGHKCKALKDRNVLLFPDVGAYDNWLARARELNLRMPATTFTVHDEMERTATDEERANGADMADRWVNQAINA